MEKLYTLQSSEEKEEEKIQNTDYRIQNIEYDMQKKTEYRIQNKEYGKQMTKYRIKNIKYKQYIIQITDKKNTK